MNERLHELRAALDEDPSSRLFYQLGELLRRDGGFHEAVRVLRAGLEHHPRYVAAWVALGRSLVATEQFAAAEEAFATALEIDPENAVAAWGIGDSAAARGDWVGAIKALKLARALSPRDERLEADIEVAEAHLAEQGLLEGGRRPVPPPAPATTIPVTRLALPKLEVIEVAEVGDPFDAQLRGESGVWELGDDVFELPPPEPDELELGEPGVVVEAPPAAGEAMEEVSWELDEGGELGPPGPSPLVDERTPTSAASAEWELDEEPSRPPLHPEPPGATLETAAWEVEAQEASATIPPGVAPPIPTPEWEVDELPPPVAAGASLLAVEVAPDPDASTHDLPADESLAPEPIGLEDEPTGETAVADELEEVPLPTLTLARLAYDQGDLGLAERTLVGVVARQPESDEARAMLARVRRERRALDEVPEIDPVAGKIAALRGWMEAIRLTSEQHRP